MEEVDKKKKQKGGEKGKSTGKRDKKKEEQSEKVKKGFFGWEWRRVLVDEVFFFPFFLSFFF